jgi:dipeptidyl aminopeptidase/acylaminoacyl peptidase
MIKNDPETGMPPWQKILLGALALLYVILFIFWFANNRNKPLFGLGEVQGFNRMPPPSALRLNMTWRFAPGLGHLAVQRVIEPPAIASPIRRLERLEAGANGAVVHRASYLSDSTLVYGVIGIPDGPGPHPAIVVCHPHDDPFTTGLHTRDTVKFLAELGVMAFAPDYRGWGPSAGQKGNEVRDVWNALASLRAESGVRADRLGLIGYSMGGGIAARAAAADPEIALLVLYYAQMFGSIEELWAGLRYGHFEQGSKGVQQFLTEGKQAGANEMELEYALRMISPIYHLRDFPGRVALFHGDQDEVISVKQSEGLAREFGRLGRPIDFWREPNLKHAFANSIENPSRDRLAEIVRETLLR